MSCGVGRRRGLDLVWLWLWCRLATVALIRPLAWELPYVMGVALKKQKKNFFFFLSLNLKLYQVIQKHSFMVFISKINLVSLQNVYTFLLQLICSQEGRWQRINGSQMRRSPSAAVCFAVTLLVPHLHIVASARRELSWVCPGGHWLATRGLRLCSLPSTHNYFHWEGRGSG